MARIRSVHPGQWTDEQFIECSFAARLLCIALRNEADDQGVFEWKPKTIKMRLMGADTVDINAILAELEQHDQVKKFTVGDRHFGAVRNFCRFQRPKKPKVVHVLPDEFRTYVGLNGDSSELDEDDDASVPPKSEISPQMEEEGGRREEEGDSEKNNNADLDFDRWYAAYPLHKARKAARKAFDKARKTASIEELIAAAKRYAHDPTRKPEFTKHPATWLNGECWRDDLLHPGPNGTDPPDSVARRLGVVPLGVGG